MNLQFHAKALGVSFQEQFAEMGEGVRKFFTEERADFSNQVYADVQRKLTPIIGSLGRVGEGVVRLFANVAYFVGRPVNDMGEALGTGAGMIWAGRSGEDRALGVASVLGGIGGAAGIATGVLGIAKLPALSINLPTLVQNSGALAVGFTAVSVPVLTAAGAVGAGYITSVHLTTAQRSRSGTRRAGPRKSDPVQVEYDRLLNNYRKTRTTELERVAKKRMDEMDGFIRSMEESRQRIPAIDKIFRRSKKPKLERDVQVEALNQALKERSSMLVGRFAPLTRQYRYYRAVNRIWLRTLPTAR